MFELINFLYFQHPVIFTKYIPHKNKIIPHKPFISKLNLQTLSHFKISFPKKANLDMDFDICHVLKFNL